MLHICRKKILHVIDRMLRYSCLDFLYGYMHMPLRFEHFCNLLTRVWKVSAGDVWSVSHPIEHRTLSSLVKIRFNNSFLGEHTRDLTGKDWAGSSFMSERQCQHKSLALFFFDSLFGVSETCRLPDMDEDSALSFPVRSLGSRHYLYEKLHLTKLTQESLMKVWMEGFSFSVTYWSFFTSGGVVRFDWK